jgi:hypothetical protein
MLSRFLILIVAVATLAPVANAQRVFRASSIDLEQNDRIDSLEAKVSRIESSVSKLVASLEKQSQPVATASQPATVTPVSVIAQAPTIRQPSSQSGYYSQAELIAIVQQAYPGGDYTRYADVSPRSGVWTHLMDGNHQFTASQVQGLPQDIALGLHGLHHANRIRATRSSRSVAPQVAYSQPAIQQSYPQPAIQQSYSQPVIQAAGGCANGQCARPSYSQPARRSFGIFRR